MTYDELLAEINRLDKALTDSYGMSALRAVVELHQPVNVWEGTGISTSLICDCDDKGYPCPTIQTIEKELL